MRKHGFTKGRMRNLKKYMGKNKDNNNSNNNNNNNNMEEEEEKTKQTRWKYNQSILHDLIVLNFS